MSGKEEVVKWCINCHYQDLQKDYSAPCKNPKSEHFGKDSWKRRGCDAWKYCDPGDFDPDQKDGMAKLLKALARSAAHTETDNDA